MHREASGHSRCATQGMKVPLRNEGAVSCRQRSGEWALVRAATRLSSPHDDLPLYTSERNRNRSRRVEVHRERQRQRSLHPIELLRRGHAAGGGRRRVHGAAGEDKTSTINNGLLPAALALGAATTQNGYDLTVTFGFLPRHRYQRRQPESAAGSALQNTALGTTGLDIRQVFMTFGNDGMASSSGVTSDCSARMPF